MLLQQYHFASIDNSKQAYIQNKTMPQRCITKTLSISENGYKYIEKKIRQFNTEITSIIHKDEDVADRVYKLNLILVPNSKKD